MPVYVYRVVGAESAETFEVRQPIHDAPLTHHPETGKPIERVICAPMVGRGALGDSQIKAAGFKKYTKTSDGTYEPPSGW